MKLLLLSLVLIFFSMFSYSQSFNTGETLRAGHFSTGINPVLSNNSLGVYLNGGYGISKQIELDLKYGIFNGQDYVGADLEWNLRSTNRMDLSIVTGAHSANYYGLDAGLVASFPVSSYVTILSGVDADFNFNMNHDRFFWWPVGVEVNLSKQVSIMLEADIPLVDFAPGIFGGGIVFYLD
jgi:hypothetical protein